MITSLSGLTPSGKAARPLREVCRRSILQVGFGAEAEVEVEAEAGASLCAGPSLLPLHTEVASSLAAVGWCRVLCRFLPVFLSEYILRRRLGAASSPGFSDTSSRRIGEDSPHYR